jgi:hypothetical protein
MSIFLDLIQSLFVRGSMVIVMLTLTVNLNDALYQRTKYANTKAHVGIVSDMMYDDLTQAGYNHTGPHIFCFAYAQDFRFHGDIDNNGTSETVRYYVAFNSGTGCWSLYRSVNSGTALEVGKRFASISFQYYDSKNKITADPSLINGVRINLVENVEGATAGFTTATRDFKIYPSNL